MSSQIIAMAGMPRSVYRYIFRISFWQQMVVIALTLSLLTLAPIPLELQRHLLDDAIAKGVADFLVRLSVYYMIALLIVAGQKIAMCILRELIYSGGWMAINGQIEVGVILAFVSGLESLGVPIRDLIGSYSQITDTMMRYKMLLSSFPDHITGAKKLPIEMPWYSGCLR